MKEIFGISINGDVIYSDNPKTIAVEALAYINVDMNFTEAIKQYNKYCESVCFEDHQRDLDTGEYSIFLKEYGEFRWAVRKIRNGRHKTYKEFPEIQFIRKEITDEEYYRMPEYH